jgi:hypothetical protein
MDAAFPQFHYNNMFNSFFSIIKKYYTRMPNSDKSRLGMIWLATKGIYNAVKNAKGHEEEKRRKGENYKNK